MARRLTTVALVVTTLLVIPIAVARDIVDQLRR